MRKKLIPMKILYENKCYITLPTAAKAFGVSASLLRSLCLPSEILALNGAVECIPEAEFNRILQDVFPNAEVNPQFTRVESLETAATALIRFAPLKELLSQGIGITNDKTEEEQYAEELQREKEKIEKKKTITESLEEYKNTLREGIKSIPLERYGLAIQTITVINTESDPAVSFLTFLAGDGIFYQIYAESIAEYDDWEHSYIDEHGVITLPSFESEEETRLTPVQGRDFRQYPAWENIGYCLVNIQAKNEWTDYLEIRSGGVNISVPMHVIMKQINPDNCPERYFLSI